MNKIVIFLTGLVVGGVASGVALKYKYDKKLENTLRIVDSEEKALKNRVKELEMKVSLYSDDADTVSKEIKTTKEETIKGIVDDAKEKKDKYSRIVQKVDYTKYARNKDIEKAAETEFPEEEDNVSMIFGGDPTLIPSDPYIITGESFAEDCEYYAKEYLTYYEKDLILMEDSTHEIISDLSDTVGRDFARYFGQNEEDPDCVYVRNDLKAIDYEIVRTDGSYEEEVLGIYADD